MDVCVFEATPCTCLSRNPHGRVLFRGTPMNVGQDKAGFL